MSESGSKPVTDETLIRVIELSRILGEFGQIYRLTLLPNGSYEPDSHHSFNLALVAYELASEFAPELDTRKILIYALVHDLPELVTGDIPTLNASPDELRQKARQDQLALEVLRERLINYPHIWEAVEAYERGEDEESLFVYWLDKMITIPTHFYDNGSNLRAMGINNDLEIEQWYGRIREKLARRGGEPHEAVVTVLQLAYEKMRDELLDRTES